MKIDFSKLDGLGNDFVFIDGMSNDIDLTTDQVKYLCDRRFGIGADGVIVVKPSNLDEASGYMHYINSDGTLAQMCGNGVRCFAKYLVDNGYVDSDSDILIADTLSGPKTITFTRGDDGKMINACVDMGNPILNPDEIPVKADINSSNNQLGSYVSNWEIESPWGSFPFTFISMGNPHAITFIDNWEEISDDLFSDPNNKNLNTFQIDNIGKYFESHEIFPEKANIEFATITPDGIAMRVFERGCGETFACGTGACAVNTAAFLTGRTGSENDVLLKGGNLHITLTPDNEILMEGPAKQSFQGTIELD